MTLSSITMDIGPSLVNPEEVHGATTFIKGTSPNNLVVPTIPLPPFSHDPSADQFISPAKIFIEEGFDAQSGILTFPNGRQLSLKLPDPFAETPQLTVAAKNLEFYAFQFRYPQTGYWIRIIHHYRYSKLEVSAAGLHFKYEGGGVGGLEGIEFALQQFLSRVGRELKGVPPHFFETTDRLRRLIPQVLKGEIEPEEPLILREALVYGKDFVRWLVANGLHHKFSTPTDGYDLVKIWTCYLILLNQTLHDFHHIDWNLLDIDYSKNLGVGKGFQSLGYGSQNHGVFRVQLKGSNAEVVVKLLPAEASDYVFREVRNYALVSEWDRGPHFYGYTLSPDKEKVGVVIDEIHDGLNTKNLHRFPQFRQEAIPRFQKTTLEDLKRIRYFFDLFSIHTGDLDFLITPDGHLHIIDPAEFIFFKEKALYPLNPTDPDYDNLEALLLSWILDGMVNPSQIPFVEGGKILEYVMRRYNSHDAIPLIRELTLRGLPRGGLPQRGLPQGTSPQGGLPEKKDFFKISDGLKETDRGEFHEVAPQKLEIHESEELMDTNGEGDEISSSEPEEESFEKQGGGRNQRNREAGGHGGPLSRSLYSSSLFPGRGAVLRTLFPFSYWR